MKEEKNILKIADFEDFAALREQILNYEDSTRYYPDISNLDEWTKPISNEFEVDFDIEMTSQQIEKFKSLLFVPVANPLSYRGHMIKIAPKP